VSQRETPAASRKKKTEEAGSKGGRKRKRKKVVLEEEEEEEEEEEVMKAVEEGETIELTEDDLLWDTLSRGRGVDLASGGRAKASTADPLSPSHWAVVIPPDPPGVSGQGGEPRGGGL